MYYQDGFDGQGSRNASSSTYDSAIITLYCEDPFWYDPTPRVVHRESGSGEDYLQPYPSVSSSQVLGATTVNNPGDILVWPEWTITGPASLITFTRTDTGDEFVLDPSLVSGSLLATEQVVVTTDPPRVRKLSAEVQTVDLGAASAGSITITFDGETTGSIAYDADAATVQAALEDLPNVDADDIAVSGGPLPAEITLSFAGQYRRRRAGSDGHPDRPDRRHRHRHHRHRRRHRELGGGLGLAAGGAVAAGPWRQQHRVPARRRGCWLGRGPLVPPRYETA